MTFEEWWDDEENADNFKQECAESKREAAELVWLAATTAERQRCREIALNVGQGGISDQWFDCADNIACRIGE